MAQALSGQGAVECGRRLCQSQAERLRIVLSTLGSDAAAIGAARLASLPA